MLVRWAAIAVFRIAAGGNAFTSMCVCVYTSGCVRINGWVGVCILVCVCVCILVCVCVS